MRKVKKQKVGRDTGGEQLPLIAMPPGDAATRLFANPSEQDDSQ